MPDWGTTLGAAMGSAWLSGVNLYAMVATLGLLERFRFAHLPGDLGPLLANWWVIGLAAGLFVTEFVADKIPAVDSVWDAIHTFIRVPAGAILAAAAFAHFDPAVRVAALLLGGGLALGAHSTKAAVRATANLSPEPFSNITLSLVEDAFVFGSSFLVAWHPVIMLGIVILCLGAIAWWLPKVVRGLRSFAKAVARKGFTLMRKPNIGHLHKREGVTYNGVRGEKKATPGH